MSPEKTRRLPYIDRLRGLAVAGMFVIHSAYAWLHSAAKDSTYRHWIMEMGGLVAPLFLFLAGVSIVILAHKAGGDLQKAQSIRRRIVLRGAQILFLGYALRFAFWYLDDFRGSWQRICKVDILQCIGLALMVLPLLAWPRDKKRFNPSALALFFVLPILHLVFYQLQPATVLPAGLAAFLTTGNKLAAFPFFPYGCWIALGMFAGGLFPAAIKPRKKELRVLAGVVAAALLCYLGSMGTTALARRWPVYRLWGDTHPMRGLLHGFLFKGAWVFLIYGVLRATAPLFAKRRFAPLIFLGKASLFAYCVHLFLIYHVAGRFVSRRLDPVGHALGALLLTAAMVALCYVWKHWSGARWLTTSWRRLPLPGLAQTVPRESALSTPNTAHTPQKKA